jgi:hypothetical protein
MPPPGKAAGHTVSLHWFTMVNLAACADIKQRVNIDNTDIFMRDIFSGSEINNTNSQDKDTGD